ncbi:hypothetical protein ABZY81_17075 [Streptomyces sp. NPDC006514]|uniref:hypothetical protein n=1 Tax=Streptomyces sp. NPDC006514 TaxID=3154308 RepID=UPI0033AF036D
MIMKRICLGLAAALAVGALAGGLAAADADAPRSVQADSSWNVASPPPAGPVPAESAPVEPTMSPLGDSSWN